MTNWARRRNLSVRQLRCSNCEGPIDVEEIYFKTVLGDQFCIDCPVEDDE